jgi:hypothetical protein
LHPSLTFEGESKDISQSGAPGRLGNIKLGRKLMQGENTLAYLSRTGVREKENNYDIDIF